jgi:hypothetical protein
MMRADQMQSLETLLTQRRLLMPHMTPPDLGYRGFNIRDFSSGEEYPAVITVYGGTIRITANNQQMYISD